MTTKLFAYLSYPLAPDTPAYGGESNAITIQSTRSMEKGESCNASHWSFSNHLGTHIDAPFHFFQNGKTITDYPAEFWIFNKICMIFLPLDEGRWITWEDISDQMDTSADLFLIKTEFSYRRQEQIYWENNPGLGAELGLRLREQCPNLRAVGFDFISLSRWQDREGGRAAHQAFLDPNGIGEPILLVEDMDLRTLDKELELDSVWIVPLRVDGSDGAPVTVIAQLKSSSPN
ncbi:MAG: cyclase family protein [SAR324 cluster bacterium]|nr:cyclase family protein [SAR324 cluster bacterium]